MLHRRTLHDFLWYSFTFAKYVDVSCLFLIACYKFLPCIIRPAASGHRFFPGPAADFFPALCNQLAMIPQEIIHRLLNSDAPTVPARLVQVKPSIVIAKSNHPLGLDAQIRLIIRATASQCLLLDVPVFHLQ
jgi:hypothetical protein